MTPLRAFDEKRSTGNTAVVLWGAGMLHARAATSKTTRDCIHD